MGKFMNVPYETKSTDKRRAGYLAYVKDGVKEALDKLKRYRVEITIDGKKYDGAYSLIMISNSDHVAGMDKFHRNVCIDDGELEVLLCAAKNKTEFVKDFILRFLGKESDGIIALTAKDIKIKLIDKPSKKWCIDGEKYEYNGDVYHIKANKKMNILAPRTSVEKLFKEDK
jgi:diacylglycerol kinase (ATP)